MTFYWWSHWFWITLCGHILLYITIVETYPSQEINLDYNNKNIKALKPITKLYQTTTLTWTTTSLSSPLPPQYSSDLPSSIEHKTDVLMTQNPISQNVASSSATTTTATTVTATTATTKRKNSLIRSVESILDDDFVGDVNETEDEIEVDITDDENMNNEFEHKRSAEEYNKTKLIVTDVVGDNLKNQLTMKTNEEKLKRKNQQSSVLKTSNKLKREHLLTHLDNYTNFSSAVNDDVNGSENNNNNITGNKITEITITGIEKGIGKGIETGTETETETGTSTAIATKIKSKISTNQENITKEATTLTQIIAPVSKFSGSIVTLPKFEAHSSTAAEWLTNVDGALESQQKQQTHAIIHKSHNKNNENNDNNDDNDDDVDNNNDSLLNISNIGTTSTTATTTTTNATSSSSSSTSTSSIQKVPFTLENVNKEDELRRAENEHRSRKSKVLSAEYRHINRYINFSTDSKNLLTRSAASTAPNDFDNDEGNISSEALSIQRTYFLDAGAILAICFTVFGICCTIGTIGIVLYRRRYLNKPQALSEPDSSVYIDDSTMRVSDNSDEMYSLDNDSFLNSLEAMTIQNYWTDTVKHTKL